MGFINTLGAVLSAQSEPRVMSHEKQPENTVTSSVPEEQQQSSRTTAGGPSVLFDLDTSGFLVCTNPVVSRILLFRIGHRGR